MPLNSLAMQVLESLPKDDALVLPGVDGGRLSVETKRVGILDATEFFNSHEMLQQQSPGWDTSSNFH